MTIEKTFSIDAEPPAIWRALWSELGESENDPRAESTWPHLLSVQVSLAGVPCRLTYRIEACDGCSEVSATLEPLSMRYGLYQVLTFGHFRRNCEMLLATGLSNLKTAVEGEPEAYAP